MTWYRFICVITLLVSNVQAQSPDRIRKVGILQGYTATDPALRDRLQALKEGLKEKGWIEGKNLTFEVRLAEGKFERVPALARELVQENVDVIVTSGVDFVKAALAASSSTPIVMATVGDAVGAGLISSLAKPGGSVTGQTLVATEQSAKRIELVKELLPKTTCIAILWNGSNISHQLQFNEMQTAVGKLQLRLLSIPIREGSDIPGKIETMVQEKCNTLITMDDQVILVNRADIVEFARRRKIPVIGEYRSFAEAGAIFSYSPNIIDMWRSSAEYVDKILNGAKPASLPVAQPTRFELVVNLKLAKDLGLNIQNTFLLRADEVMK